MISAWDIIYAVGYKGLWLRGAVWARDNKWGVTVLHVNPGINMNLPKEKVEGEKRRESRKLYLIFKS